LKKLTHLSLFSGIGGLDLAAERAGLQTVGQCEFADYPYKVLCKHWPDVPKWRDIRTLTGEDFHARTGLRTVDVLSGGFPCQPFSVAGKRRGAEDDRYLWPEMLRVIKELRPAWVIGENVAGIVNMALDTVLSELEAEGYETRAFIVPACGVDAPHRRDRVAIVARHNDGKPNGRKPLVAIPREDEGKNAKPCGVCYDVAHPEGEGIGGLSVQCRESQQADTDAFWRRKIVDNSYGRRFGRHIWREQFAQSQDGCWWSVEPDVGRVAHGIPHRVDRLRCLGNAVVPAQFYPIFNGIAQAELLGKEAQK
jgi:DNA (cytosine-5)-methyltransferase 1